MTVSSPAQTNPKGTSRSPTGDRSGPPSPVVLITGASSGIGQACGRHLAAQGCQVFGTSRQARPTDESTPEQGYRQGRLHLLGMDVDDSTSVSAGIDAILLAARRLDVIVCNAGYGLAGAVEDCALAEVKAQFETNFFGAWRVCRAALPIMRRQRKGTIVLMGSLAGLMGVPFQAAYSASKFALEGMAEALRMEVKPWGVHVVLVEPGDYCTGFTRNRVRARAAGIRSAYADAFQRALAVMAADERKGPDPHDVARLIARIIAHPSPRLRYTAGRRIQRSGALLKRMLPSRLFEWIMLKTYDLH